MKVLIDEIEDLIDEHYREELRELKFKSADDEESIWTMIDELKEDVGDMLREKNFQIEGELADLNVEEKRSMCYE